MTDQTEEQSSTVTAGEDLGTAGENLGTAGQEVDQNVEKITKKMENMSTSFSIWPPSQRTREAVIKRLIDTLSGKSVLTDRYGVIPSDDAAGFARRIEEEAFSASPASPLSDGDDGIEILQSYSKEISKRMLDFVKSRSVTSADESATVTPVMEEEGSTVET